MNAQTISDQAAWELSNQLILTVKLMVHMRDQVPSPIPEVEASALPLLFHLKDGPHRVSDLAEVVYSDVSTVSRQTTNLAKHGLLEKVCNATDRRVQLITLTDAGREVIEHAAGGRREWFARVLADWDPDDIDAFRVYLERFTADVKRTARAGG